MNQAAQQEQIELALLRLKEDIQLERAAPLHASAICQVVHNTTTATNDVQYNFGYDTLNRPTTVKVGTASLSTNAYNTDGTLNNVTYGNNGKVTYVYDAFKRVSGLRYDAQSTDRYQYAYDAEGRLGWVQDNALGRVHSSAYDTAGRPVRAQTMAGAVHVYTAEVDYDTFNNIAAFKEQVGSGRTPYVTTGSYDAENRPTLLTYGSAANSVCYGYDGVGRVGTRTAKIGSAAYATTYGYLAGDAVRYGAGATTPLVSAITQTGHTLNYTYDDVGNITSCTYGGKTTTYAYGTLGQLIRVNDPQDTTSGATGTTWTYHYDQGGNIQSVKRYAYTTGTLGAVLQTIPYTYTDANWKDKLTSYAGTAITYDTIGNPLTDGTWAYTWQAGRQLASMSKTGTTASFLYNADGLRTRKIVNSTVTDYTLHGKNVVHLKQGSNNLHFFYDASGRPSHVNFNGTMYLYVHNLQGDIIAIRDAAGNNVVTYSYNAWGKQMSKAGTLAATLGTLNPFRYRGYVYDEETGLYYLRSRYYNPTWKRFVSSESIKNPNVFQYCKNSPLIHIDNDGTSTEQLDEEISIFDLSPPWSWGLSKPATTSVLKLNITITEGMIRLLSDPLNSYYISASRDEKGGLDCLWALIESGDSFAARTVDNLWKELVRMGAKGGIISSFDDLQPNDYIFSIDPRDAQFGNPIDRLKGSINDIMKGHVAKVVLYDFSNSRGLRNAAFHSVSVKLQPEKWTALFYNDTGPNITDFMDLEGHSNWVFFLRLPEK